MTDEEFHDDYFGTFCVYCQREYGTEKKLIEHVLDRHPGTYAANFVRKLKR